MGARDWSGQNVAAGFFRRGATVDGLAPAKFAYASPVVAGRRLFLFDDAGHAAVLDAGRTFRVARVNQLAEACVGTPFFVRDKIIVRGSQTVYCLGE